MTKKQSRLPAGRAQDCFLLCPVDFDRVRRPRPSTGFAIEPVPALCRAGICSRRGSTSPRIVCPHLETPAIADCAANLACQVSPLELTKRCSRSGYFTIFPSRPFAPLIQCQDRPSLPSSLGMTSYDVRPRCTTPILACANNSSA